MKMKLMTVGVLVAAGLILVPFGISKTRETRAQPVVPAAAVNPSEATVGKVIAAQGNAALHTIRAEVTRPTPPDLEALRQAGQPE